MSKLTDLIGRVAQKDPALAEELRKEFAVYANRRVFGLNFERHMPETVRLYDRPIRRGDKVNILPARGEKEKVENKRIWLVKSILEKAEGTFATLAPVGANFDQEEPPPLRFPLMIW
ncbi:MAG: hypothetical protein FWF45_01605 [Coriobacteriia bacterium]|nr:hypothetical protein [Coriobacteriia bacterium]